MSGVPPRRARPPLLWLLLGKPPERSPVIPDVIARLVAEGADVRVQVDRVDAPLPERLTDADAVLLRGLRGSTLEAVAELEARGLRCCNPARSTILTTDRGLVHQHLADAGIPVPSATTVPDAEHARAWAAGSPVVLKVNRLEASEAKAVARWDDPATVPPLAVPGPYLVQRWVPSDGVDRKLYVIGGDVRGLLKPWSTAKRRPGTVFDPPAHLREIALAVGRTLQLQIYGVDVVDGDDGPVVVDVNAFPSCNGIPGSATAIADTLLAYAVEPSAAIGGSAHRTRDHRDRPSPPS